MWGCEDLDQQMWGCEDVNQQISGCEDVLQRLLFYEEPFAGALGNKKRFYIIFIFVLNVDEDFVGDAGDEWQKISGVSALKLIGGVVQMPLKKIEIIWAKQFLLYYMSLIERKNTYFSLIKSKYCEKTLL